MSFSVLVPPPILKDYENRSKVRLDARKVKGSSKTSIQNKVGCTKSRGILKNIDPKWCWMHEKSRHPRKRRSRVGLDARKVKASLETQNLSRKTKKPLTIVNGKYIV